jgi:hypothetical protein
LSVSTFDFLSVFATSRRLMSTQSARTNVSTHKTRTASPNWNVFKSLVVWILF